MGVAQNIRHRRVATGSAFAQGVLATAAIATSAATMGFRLDGHEHSDARGLRTIGQIHLFDPVCHPTSLGPPIDQPAAAAEDLARRFNLRPSGRDVTAALLDERPCDGFDGNSFIGHGH
jgi:hypothetical protein